MSSINRTTEVRLALSDLPEFDPDPALWVRIRAANVQRVRLRRVRRIGALGVVFAGVVTSWLLGLPHGLSLPTNQQAGTNWQAHSQQLQDQWDRRADQDVDPHVQARLRLLDRDLQAAYDRGASEPELAPLWSLRTQLLQSLVESQTGRSRRLTRI